MPKLEEHRCHICFKLYTYLKTHLSGKHRHVGDNMPRPTPKDTLEYYRKYYNT